MCGICGAFGEANRTVVEMMLETLRHRGPDDGHILSGHDFTIGARRLSIVDVAGGRQPLTNEDGTVTAAQNGELYNFPEARDALVKRGHRLATRTDTEILPHLWEEYGEALPQHIDGMFAVAVWDSRRQIGLLARDRMEKALVLLAAGRHAVLRVRIESDPGDSGIRAPAESGGSASLSQLQARAPSPHDLRGCADAPAGTSARLPSRTDTRRLSILEALVRTSEWCGF